MASSTVAILTPIWRSSPTNTKSSYVNPRICYTDNVGSNKPQSTILTNNVFLQSNARREFHAQHSPKALSFSSAVGSEYVEEPETKVKFQTLLSLPGCSSLSFLGAGYREKVFAAIGVKVYAAALYANQMIFSQLDSWKGRSAAEVQQNSTLFDAIFQASLEKSLHIVLVRDVDGKTFWDALDKAISPRIKSPTPVDESALSTFRGIFEGRSLRKGTSIFLTWLDTTKMLVCVSSDGTPSAIDATIESSNVISALFDVFLGPNPVSPTLKSSVSNGLAASLK